MTCQVRFAQHVQRGHTARIIKLMQQRLTKHVQTQITDDLIANTLHTTKVTQETDVAIERVYHPFATCNELQWTLSS